MRYIFIISLLALSIRGKSQDRETKNLTSCTESCSDKCSTKTLACKLTSPELQKRKETVIASLKKQVIKKNEIENGYTFEFEGDDKIIDELTEFIKTERLCCDFFDFEIKVSGDRSAALLSITGPEGVKEFINSELEF
ncbi:MAG: hypothetical protein LBF27_14265 [Sphingobacterium sp.]|jgi:hypothetical protein|nr:hypothetical protein [Sphingobacterium sp.]